MNWWWWQPSSWLQVVLRGRLWVRVMTLWSSRWDIFSGEMNYISPVSPERTTGSLHLIFWKLRLAGHTLMLWLGLFAYLEHIICLDWSLPRTVSDVFLPYLLHVFTISIGICLVSTPPRKTCCRWTISDCQIHVHVTAFSRMKSPSNCNHSNNLLSWMLATSISLTISSCKSPKLQCLAKAYTSLTKDAAGSISSCHLWSKLIQSKLLFGP